VETTIVDAIGPALLDAAGAAGMGIAVVAMEAGGPRTLHVNAVLCELVGRTSEALLVGSLFDVVMPADRARIEGSYARRTRGEQVDPRFDVHLQHANGEAIPVAVGICVARLDETRVEVFFVTDMRARMADMARLRASEQRFRELVEAAPDGIVISRRGGIVYANRAAGTLLGTPAEALAGRSFAEFLPPEDLARMGERLQALSRGETFPPTTYSAKRPDGSVVIAEIASMITEHEGAPAVLAFARDVTERTELAAGLERAERLAAVGRLAAGMAHEINNPLAFISLNAEALGRKLDAILPAGRERDDVMALLDELLSGSERVAGIVRDLKSFSREGEAEEERGPAQLEPVLTAAIRMVEHEIAPRARLVRAREASEAGVRVVGDPRRLVQVFVNLLVNAAQAFAERARGVIEIRESVTEGEVTIEVHDDGAGISEEHLGRVFNPFFTTKPVGVGTGLGLSICHGIVTACGGRISIESELGRGTTVRVVLLRAKGDAPISVVPAEPEPKPPQKPRGRVLIIEDQEALALTLSRLLASTHEVEIASRVSVAVAKLAPGEPPFDAVLCDMLMPDGTGIDVFERTIAERPELAGRFVFMTGGAFTEDVAEFLERVPNARLEKPFAMAELEEAIARAAD
jgi:PAS domain S-box-containing protein